MKLQLEKEVREIEGQVWYRITMDDCYMTGSFNREEIEQLFEKIKANPELLKNEKEVLRSEEI